MKLDRIAYIFTYGTLMSSAEGPVGAAERAMMSRGAELVGNVVIRGQLFDAGLCPGVILAGGSRDRVQGELWRLPVDRVELLAALDRYEGCAPGTAAPPPYARRTVRIREPHGRRVTAWIYVWLGSTSKLPRIADGRWRPVQRPRETTVPPERVRI